jgi:hypothetical protein
MGHFDNLVLQIMGEREVVAKSEPKTAFNVNCNVRMAWSWRCSLGETIEVNEQHLCRLAYEIICGCQPVCSEEVGNWSD